MIKLERTSEKVRTVFEGVRTLEKQYGQSIRYYMQTK